MEERPLQVVVILLTPPWPLLLQQLHADAGGNARHGFPVLASSMATSAK